MKAGLVVGGLIEGSIYSVTSGGTRDSMEAHYGYYVFGYAGKGGIVPR